jgi:hypothetical protein
MQQVELRYATLCVADITDASGRVTAESIEYGLCGKRQSSPSRICGLTIFGLAVVGALASLIPTPAQAQGVAHEIAELKAQVAALQSQVQTVQTELAAVQSNNALKLGPFVDVDPNPENGVIGPNIKFTGANIHILSGSGETDDGGSLTGLGNLIIGYDELSPGQVDGRGGSHNLAIGRFHAFTSSAWGGLVAGEENVINAASASVTGGTGNTASGSLASVTGGTRNTASGSRASVSGGDGNTASVLASSVNGGAGNTASGIASSVSGGAGNTASGLFSTVIGGLNNTASNTNSIAPQNLSLFP